MDEIEIAKPFDGGFNIPPFDSGPRPDKRVFKRLLFEMNKVFSGMVVMGDDSCLIATGQEVRKYKKAIERSSQSRSFKPIMSVMLTKRMSIKKLDEAHQAGAEILYYIPFGVFPDLDNCIPLYELKNYYYLLKRVKKHKMTLVVRWQHCRDCGGKEIALMDMEIKAIKFFEKLVHDIPGLRIVAQSISTKQMVESIRYMPGNIAASIPLHSLLVDNLQVIGRNGRLKDPKLYTRPIAQQEIDRRELLSAIIYGGKRFFYETDTFARFEPLHEIDPVKQKIVIADYIGYGLAYPPELLANANSDNGYRDIMPAGIFHWPSASLVRLWELLFNRLKDKEFTREVFERFVSFSGPDFYGLSRSRESITIRECVPYEVRTSLYRIPVFHGGKVLKWGIQQVC